MKRDAFNIQSDIQPEEYHLIREDLEVSGKELVQTVLFVTMCFVQYCMWFQVEYNGECCQRIYPNGRACTTIVPGYGRKDGQASVFLDKVLHKW